MNHLSNFRYFRCALVQWKILWALIANHEFGRGNSEAWKTKPQMQPIYMVTNGNKVLLFP